MSFYRATVKKIVNKIPGKRIFGHYRILPVCFILGAALEFFMIHWHVGEVNFYKVYKRKRIEELVEERLQQEA